MSRPQVPTAEQAEIIRRDHIDPDEVAVIASAEDMLVLLCYDTRDNIMISAGDRPWKKGKNHDTKRKK